MVLKNIPFSFRIYLEFSVTMVLPNFTDHTDHSHFKLVITVHVEETLALIQSEIF